MLGHLIRKEILDHILSLRFMILSAIAAMVIWLSLYDGYAYYRARTQDYRLAQAAKEGRLREIEESGNWSEITARGYRVHKPPVPLSLFIRGLDPYLGRSIRVTAINRMEEGPAAMEPILGFFLPLDLGQAIQVVLSLFILLLTYDAVTGEKEGGTLRLVGSFPVSRAQLLAGKLLGAMVPTLAAFGTPLLLGIGVALLASDVHLGGPELVRLGLVLVALVIYLSVFACAGLLGSSLTHRAATSFVILQIFWVATVVVLPRLSLIAADGLRPAPSIHETQEEKIALANAAGKKVYEMWGAWEKKHFIPGANPQPPEIEEGSRLYLKQIREEIGKQSREEAAHIDEAFRNRYEARLDLAVLMARFSPAFAWNNATIGLTGTGTDRQRRFVAAFEDYFRQYGAWAVAAKHRDALRRANPAKYGPFRWDLTGMPRFQYRDSWPAGDIQTAMIDVGVMALWALAFFAGSFGAMLRYDLR